MDMATFNQTRSIVFFAPPQHVHCWSYWLFVPPTVEQKSLRTGLQAHVDAAACFLWPVVRMHPDYRLPDFWCWARKSRAATSNTCVQRIARISNRPPSAAQKSQHWLKGDMKTAACMFWPATSTHDRDYITSGVRRRNYEQQKGNVRLLTVCYTYCH